MEPCLPYYPSQLGLVVIENQVGSARFLWDRRHSTIVSSLADKLKLGYRHMTCVDGFQRWCYETSVMIGHKEYDLKFRFVIVSAEEDDNYSGMQAGESWTEKTEIEFGTDFINLIELDHKTLSSTLVGLVQRPTSVVKFHTRNYSNTSYKNDINDRVWIHFDMDVFTVQVYEHESQKGKPRVVTNNSGLVIASSHEAKLKGINRDRTPYIQNAKEIYKQIIEIPQTDAKKLKDANAKIIAEIKSITNQLYGCVCQYHSDDDFYVDITEEIIKSEQNGEMSHSLKRNLMWKNSYFYDGQVDKQPEKGHASRRADELKRNDDLDKEERQEMRLLYASTIAAKIMNHIFDRTKYQSTVGIACNKLIAKLACQLHKPGSVSIICPSGFDQFSRYIKIENLPGLGGNLIKLIKEEFDVDTMEDLQGIEHRTLASCLIYTEQRQESIGWNKATHILNLANGLQSQSLLSANSGLYSNDFITTKQFYGQQLTRHEVEMELKELIDGILRRLEFEQRVNSRKAKLFRLTIRTINGFLISSICDLTVCENGVIDVHSIFGSFMRNSQPPLSLACWDDCSEVRFMDILTHFHECSASGTAVDSLIPGMQSLSTFSDFTY